MAFPDPVVLDLAGTPITLPKVSVGDFKSSYMDSTGNYTFSAATNYGRRTRSTVRLDCKQLVVNPEIPATNNPVSMSAYLVIDRNAVGWSSSQLEVITVALVSELTANTNELIKKVLSGQS